MFGSRCAPRRPLPMLALGILAAVSAPAVAQDRTDARDGGILRRWLDWGRDAGAQQHAPAASNLSEAQHSPSNLVVLRLSEDLFTSLIDRDVDELTAVSEVILGTPVTGQARTVARPIVDLVPDDSRAAMEVVLEGTTVSRTVGRNRSAIIHSRCTTWFRATKQVVYEPGRGFRAQPAVVTARTELVTEGVGSTRRRLMGRLVRRMATRQAQQQHSQAEAIAHGKAVARIQSLFERKLENGLAKLNRSSELRSAIAALRPGTDDPHFVCCSTDQCVQIALAGGRRLPVELPDAQHADGRAQLWIHSSVLAQAADARDRASWLLNGLRQWSADSPVALVAALRPLAGLLSEDVPLNVTTAEDWVVVELSRGIDEPRVARRP